MQARFFKKIPRTKVIFSILLWIGCWLPRLGLTHEAWVDLPADSAYPILYGYGRHKTEPYAADKVQTVTAYDAAKQTLPVTLSVENGLVNAKVKGEPAVFTVTFDNGYWQKTGKNYRALGENQITDRKNVVKVYKFGKTVLAWVPWIFEPLGLRMEIIPLPFRGTPKAGDKIMLQVRLDGKVLPHAKIRSTNEKISVLTDDAGQAQMILKKGLQRFSVEAEIPDSQNPKADTLSLTGSLIFSLAN